MTSLLRPFTVGELLDGAFSLYRRNFSSFFVTSFVPQIPLIMLWLALPIFAGAGDPDAAVQATTLLSMPYSWIAAGFIACALVFASIQALQGAPVSAGEALKVGLRKLPAATVAIVLMIVLIACGLLLLVIPGLILMAMYFAVLQAIVVEDCGPVEALGRSRRLSKGARIRILGVAILAYLIAALPVIAFSMITGVAATRSASGVVTSNLTIGWQSIVQAGALALSALTTPYSVAALTLLYIDRRARTEAPDLEEAAARLSGV